MAASPAAIGASELRAAALAGTVVTGGGRTIDATVIRECCLDQGERRDPHGLRLAGVSVAGPLDLAGITLPVPLRFDHCAFDGPVTVEGAELFELALTGCSLPGLLGNGLRLRRDLDLSESRIAGAYQASASTSRKAAVWLCEATIGGRLLCISTEIDGQGERSIQADRAQITGAVRFIHQFTARGEIRLLETGIGASLDLNGAHIDGSYSQALDLGNATIGGSLFLIEGPSGRRPGIRGRVSLTGLHVAGRLLVRNADLAAPDPAAGSDLYRLSLEPGIAVHGPRLTVDADVTFAERCLVTGTVNLFMSDLGSLTVGGECRLESPGRTALSLTNALVRGSVRIDRGSAVAGTLRLEGATVNGTLGLHAAMRAPENRSLVSATAVTVDGDVYLEDLTAAGGRLNFRSATLGPVLAANARIDNPAAETLMLSQAKVRGSLNLVDGFSSAGTVEVNLTRVEGRLLLRDGTFTSPQPGGRPAIEAISASAAGGMDLGWREAAPAVDFTNATTTFLADDPATWPERYLISGLTYDRFELPQGSAPRPVWDEAARRAWLDRQANFDSGTYEQAARVFRQHGYVTEAEQILIAQRRRAREVSRPAAAWPRRAGLRAVLARRVRLPAAPGPVAAGGAADPRRRLARGAGGSGVAARLERQWPGLLSQRSCRPAGPPRSAVGHSRQLRGRPGPLLQPGAVRGGHGGAADLARSALDLVSGPARSRWLVHALVAQRRDNARLAAVVDFRAVAGQSGAGHVISGCCPVAVSGTIRPADSERDT